jgi:hypothetical protein
MNTLSTKHKTYKDKCISRGDEVTNLYTTSLSEIMENPSQIGQKLPRSPLGSGARVGERKKKSLEGGSERGERKNYSCCTFVQGQDTGRYKCAHICPAWWF